MSEGATTPCFADRAWHGATTLIENVRLSRDTYRARFECPELAKQVTPGQFLMVRLANCDDPLLGRPLALYDTVCDAQGEPYAIGVVYLVAGKLTRRLASSAPGTKLEAWGPLGNGFARKPVDHLIMVAGGIGQTPFLAMAKWFLGTKQYGVESFKGAAAKRITLCYGARNKDYFAGIDDFEHAGVKVLLSTDDGSMGHHGFVTEVMHKVLGEQPANEAVRVACCGPEPMMAATAKVCERANVECEVSLETPMACGLGICFSCVAPVKDSSGAWDYRRTCVEGPVFDSRRIAFDAMTGH